MISDIELRKYHDAKGHQINTRALIRGALRHWNRLRCGNPTDDALARYRDERLAEGAAKDTVRGELSKLIALANYLNYPANVKKPSKIQRAPNAWSRREIRTLFNEARTTWRVIYGLPGSEFWPAILGVAYDTGERIGAIRHVTWDAINLEGRTVLYKAEIRKGGYRDAMGKLSRGTRRDLQRLHAAIVAAEKQPDPTPTSPVFLLGSESTLYVAYTRILRDAGLPCDRRSKFHRLRRTHATYIAAAGGDATAALGHSTDEVTRGHYLDPTMLKKTTIMSPRRWTLMEWLLGQ